MHTFLLFAPVCMPVTSTHLVFHVQNESWSFSQWLGPLLWQMAKYRCRILLQGWSWNVIQPVIYKAKIKFSPCSKQFFPCPQIDEPKNPPRMSFSWWEKAQRHCGCQEPNQVLNPSFSEILMYFWEVALQLLKIRGQHKTEFMNSKYKDTLLMRLLWRIMWKRELEWACVI